MWLPGGHAWLLGGHAWLPVGVVARGVCMVASGHVWLLGGLAWLPGWGGVHGCWGACVVVGECLVAGGMHGCPGGVPCDLSHHAFDVKCMLPPHQLRPTNSAAAYIVLVGHVTCKASWDTHPPPPVNRISHTCKNITFPQLRMRAVMNYINIILAY